MATPSPPSFVGREVRGEREGSPQQSRYSDQGLGEKGR